ncbi:MAG: CaiB/BaiF CoA transferase family protein [Candidatus Binatia bacterium]
MSPTRPTSEEQALQMPAFGPLQGLRILDTGRNNAGPWAATLAAEFGAEVIHVEPPQGEIYRFDHAAWAQEKRNQRGLTLDLRSAPGHKIFLQLCARADIWIESSIPGTYPKLGLDDATVWSVNPKLVIAHVSGFGQTGHPDYVRRASYDMIGQAFGGLMFIQGLPDPHPPIAAKPYLCDYITGLWTLWSTLAACLRAQRTGEGQAIDISQYECMLRMLADTAIKYFENGEIKQRLGNRHPIAVPWDTYQSGDGAWFCINAAGAPFARLCQAIGVDPDDERWCPQFEKCLAGMPGAEAFETELRRWLQAHTAAEVETNLTVRHQVPCQRVYSIKDLANDPHCAARRNFIRWHDAEWGDVRGVGIMPSFSLTPGAVWRGAPTLGQDNEEILHLLGYDGEAIAALRAAQVIGEGSG